MKRNLVRYKVKPERVEENKQLIEAVFKELRTKSPDSVRYAALTLGDGTFVHLVELTEGTAAITELPAFRAFQEGIKERCLEPPVVSEATVVGDYRLLGW